MRMKTIGNQPNLRFISIISLMIAILGSLLVLLPAKLAAQVDPAAPAVDVPVQVGDLQAQADNIRAEIDRLNRDLEITVEHHNATQVEFQRLTQDLADSRAQLDFLRSEQHSQEEILNNRLVAVYRSGDVSIMTLLMNSGSISDFIDQTIYVARVNEQDVKLEKQFEERAQEIALVTNQIDEKRAQQMLLEQDLADQKVNIERKIEDRQEKLDHVDAQVKQILDQEAERRRAEQARIANEHQSLLSELKISDELQKQVVLTALQYLGVPYVWGGESPSGFDCSGLSKYIFAQYGVDLPHYAASQFNMGTPVSTDELQPGDLLFWGPGNPHHVAMYIGNGKYIEAPNFDEVVCVSTLEIDSDYAGARRFPLQPQA